jgi:hypothetical protein
MKAKRRQELKTNELAIALTQLRDWYDKNSTLVWGVTLGVVVVLIVSTLWYRSSVSRRAENWNRFYTLQQQLFASMQGAEGADPEPAVRELTDLASSAGDPQIRVAASLAIARFEWQRAGAPGVATSQQSLSQVDAAFERIIETRKASELSRLVAKVGRAAVLENEGDIAGAKAAYEEVEKAEAAKHSGLAVLASEALKRLNQEVFAAAFPSKPVPPAATAPAVPSAVSANVPDAAPEAADKQPPADSGARITSFVPTTQPAGEGE